MRRIVLLLVVVAPLAAQADAAKLVRKPKIMKVGDGFEVSFAVSQSTDVEVSILDKEGRVVRHLAAGVIGQDVKSPPPLKPGRSQNLVWDGKDDNGKSVGRGPFTMRVRAGHIVTRCS